MKIKKDDEGREFFNPTGLSGKTYLIENDEQRKRIKKYINVEFVMRFILLFIIVATVSSLNSAAVVIDDTMKYIIIGSVVVVSALIPYAVLKLSLRGMKVHHKRKFLDHFQESIKNIPTAGAIFLAVFFIVLGSLHIYVHFDDVINEGMNSADIINILIGVVAILFAVIVLFFRFRK